jgi:1-acyl-sn-glycerol-3-phosphate acyltransferase
MYDYMKTTVEIPDALLKAAKRAASRDGVTVRALLIEGLHRVLESRKRDAVFHLRDASFAGEGLRPEVADGPWERLRDLAYEGRGA